MIPVLRSSSVTLSRQESRLPVGEPLFGLKYVLCSQCPDSVHNPDG